MGSDLWRRVLLIVAVFAIVPAAALLREVFEDDPCSDTASIALALSCAPEEEERLSALPASVTSPAPQSASECKSIPLVRAQQAGADALPETLGSYIPIYVPDGAGLFGTWHETLAEHGPGAIWVTEDCRTVKVTLVETKRPREGPWKIWMSRRCTVASIGKTMCIDASADVPYTHLNLTTAGFSEAEVMRIAESIEL